MDFSQIGVLQANNRPKISPLCKGWHGFLPPKKAYEKLYFHPAPRSYQPMPFSVLLVNLSQDNF